MRLFCRADKLRYPPPLPDALTLIRPTHDGLIKGLNSYQKTS